MDKIYVRMCERFTQWRASEPVEVDVETSEVTVSHSKDVISLLKEKLSKLGYPEAGDKNTVMHKAKSFVSCAVGRLDS